MGNPISRDQLTEILVKGMQQPSEEAAETVDDNVVQEKSLSVEETYEDDSEVVSEIKTQEEQVAETEAIQEEISEVESEISNLNELAQAIEVDPEWLYSIKIPISDGRDPISLSELKDQYQEYSRVNSLKAQLESERAELKSKMEARESEVNQSLQQFQNMPQELMAANAEVMSIAYQYNNYDWATLEKESPGEAALAKQNLATAYQVAQSKVAQLQSDVNNKLASQANAIANKEKTAILKYIPEWHDDSKRVEGQNQIRSMLKEYGYTDGELNSLVDHRALRIANDLMNLKGTMKRTKNVVKKLQKVPKVIKPGAVSAPKSKKQIQQDIIDKAAKSKSTNVKVRAIGQLLMNR